MKEACGKNDKKSSPFVSVRSMIRADIVIRGDRTM